MTAENRDDRTHSPRVAAVAPLRTTDQVYTSLQVVEFADGRRAQFASTAPIAPGTVMAFDPSFLDREPAINVGGTLVTYLVPATWAPTGPAPAAQRPGPATFAGRGAAIGGLIGAMLGLVLSLVLMSSAYESAADKTLFVEPQVNVGKAAVMFVLTMGCTAAVGVGLGAAIGAAMKRR
ncbi:hypothetical protein AXK57_21835 [Tsukamurella pulmonis]|nr:hypothetical protein AXK57_21835 [Tsukamurella pulmonis]